MNELTFEHSSGKFVVKFSKHIVDDMVEFCSSDLANETGGILIGKYSTNSMFAYVKKADVAPSDSEKGNTWFQRGVAGLKQMLNQFWNQEQLFYIGEWHYHPYSSPAPSGTDKKAMIDIATNDENQCKTPILIIIGGDVTKKPLLSVSVVTSDKKFVQLNFRI